MANKRFVKRTSSVSGSQLDAMIAFYQAGGTIQVVKSSKRPKRGYTVGRTKTKVQ
jgi:hypothetical protein